MHQAKRNIFTIKNQKKDIQYTVIIPAAGEGYRMKSYGSKSLIEILPNIKLFDYQLQIIKQIYAIEKIVLVTGYESDKVMAAVPNYVIKIENENYNNTNTSRSIGLALRATDARHIILIYGDLVFNKNSINHKFDEKSTVIIDHNTMSSNEIGCVIHNGILEHMMYENNNKWAQIAYFTGIELELLRKITYDKNNSMLFGFEVINKIVEMGGKFVAVSPPGIKINDIDTTKDLAEIGKIL